MASFDKTSISYNETNGTSSEKLSEQVSKSSNIECGSVVSDVGSEITKSETQTSEKVEAFDEISLKESSVSSELGANAHEITKTDMISKYGVYMNAEHIEMLNSKETAEKIHVVSSDEYIEKFPENDFNVLGHCDIEGTIYIKDISPEIVKHVSTHETMHLCSDRETYMDENGNAITVSGLRTITICNDGTITDNGRAINEGMTEMFTLRELNQREEFESVSAVKSYTESREWAERLELLLGSEKINAAYFGNDKESMINEFNKLNDNNSEAWDLFSKDIDTLEYSNDEDKIIQAKWRLFSQFSTMYENKLKVREN